jgi:hypothetical protein
MKILMFYSHEFCSKALEQVLGFVEYLRKLKRTPNKHELSVMACYRNDRLESIVRCAGEKHGYV